MNVDFTDQQLVFFGVLALWEMIWKGLALWRAARMSQPYWFLALLIINTAGIFPILYLLFTSKEYAKVKG